MVEPGLMATFIQNDWLARQIAPCTATVLVSRKASSQLEWSWPSALTHGGGVPTIAPPLASVVNVVLHTSAGSPPSSGRVYWTMYVASGPRPLKE